MKGIVFLGNRRCEVRDFPVAEPGRGQVLLRIEATGICGSDLSVYRSGQATDQIRGHEPCGVVEKLGPDIVRLKVGDRVSVHHHQGCGVCPICATGEVVACQNGKHVYGVGIPGSFAEHMVATERNCILLPDSVSFIDGAFMACVGGTAYGALRRLGAMAHETLAVFGLGPVGLSCVIMGKAMGCRVAGVDVLKHRLELATKCGADATVNAAETDAAKELHGFSMDVGRRYLPGMDYVIETSGSAPARRQIIPSLRREGKAAIVGVGSNEPVINPSDIHGRACTLIGSVVFPLGWSWDLAKFLSVSRASFEPAVTHRFSLDDAKEALHTADNALGGKVVFLPSASKAS